MNLQLLDGLTAPQFLARHWQKKPLLVRNAIPDFVGPVRAGELLKLASREDVESRLVRGSGAHLSLEHGPFRASRLRSLPPRNWTLLVQGLNLHVDAADRLLRRFSFIPYARLDDVMVSYAAPGGGVGAHMDSYDVFLLQGEGRRLWRIGRSRNARLVEGSALRLLRSFKPTAEYLLKAGDMLYLPPGWGHEGTAQDACLTYSIGFRAPARRELLSEFLVRQSERIDLPGLYEDPHLRLQARPAALPQAMIDRTAEWVARLRHSRQDVRNFLGEYLSEPKPSIIFDRPSRPLSLARFARRVRARGVRSDARTLMLHSAGSLFINGESVSISGTMGQALMRLADQRSLAPGRHSQALCALLHEWYRAGWMHADAEGGRTAPGRIG